MIRGVIMLCPAQTNLSYNAVDPGVTRQLIDLLPSAADLSLNYVASPRSSDRLKAAVGLKPGHHNSLSIQSSVMMSPPCFPCSQASSRSKSRLGDVSDVDDKSSNNVADPRRTLGRMDNQAQHREVNPSADRGHSIGDYTASA